MSLQKREIRATVADTLSTEADPLYRMHGFLRREQHLTYVRTIDTTRQSVRIWIEHGPKDNRNASAAIYPTMAIAIPEVDAIAHEMIGCDPPFLIQPTFQQPIQFLAPKGTGARWFLYQPDSVATAVADFALFSNHWVFPFMHELTSAQSLVTMYQSGDQRLLRDIPLVLRIVAALLQLGEKAEAYSMLQTELGKPANRRLYAQVFEFVERQQ